MASGRGEEPGGAAQRLWESVERSDEENLKEECSSTESTQQEVGSLGVECGVGPGSGVNARAQWQGSNGRIKFGKRPKV